METIKTMQKPPICLHLGLDEIGVRNNSVSDVINLNCRKDSETSFCISLNDKSSKDIVYDSKCWPFGTRVRPLTQKARKPKHQNKYHDFLGDINMDVTVAYSYSMMDDDADTTRSSATGTQTDTAPMKTCEETDTTTE